MKQVKWLALAAVVFVGSAMLNRACTNVATLTPAAKLADSQQTSTPTPTQTPPQPIAPTRLAKPNTPPNPKYDTTLSAAQPADEQKIRAEWYAYDQQECTDKTLARDKKDLTNVQRARLTKIKNSYHAVMEHKQGDMVTVVRAKEYLDHFYSRNEDKSKLLFTTPCLEMRGDIPNTAKDLNPVHDKLLATFDRLIKAYDDKFSSDSIAAYSRRVQGYHQLQNEAEKVIGLLK